MNRTERKSPGNFNLGALTSLRSYALYSGFTNTSDSTRAFDLHFMNTSKVRAHVVQLFTILKISPPSLHYNVHRPRSRSHIKLV